MTAGINDLFDPSVCSCFPTSYRYTICNKLKWSIVSISVALIIVIVYASSGLYTLIDVATLMSMDSYENKTVTIFWPIFSSPMMIMLDWLSLSVYFSIVLFIVILFCGIQLRKPWLLFIWSIIMIFMLLADGIITVFCLRQYQQQNFRPLKQVKILFCVMIIRLFVSLCGIFIIMFYFHELNKMKSEYINRQKMLQRYHAQSATPSFNSSWTRTGTLLNRSKDNSDDHYIPEIPVPMVLPRAKVATVQRHPSSTMFYSRNSLDPQIEYTDQSHQLPIHEYDENYRLSLPLDDRSHQRYFKNPQEL